MKYNFVFFYFVIQVVVVLQLLLVTTNTGGGGRRGGRGGVVLVQAQAETEATIADKWRIDTEVDIDYFKYVFDFTYTVSNFIDVGQAGFYIYSKECRSGGGTIQTVGFDTSLTIANGGQDVTPGSETDITKIDMSKTVTVPIKIDYQDTMVLNEELYTDNGDNTMKFEFCLVFYLQTPDGSIEVNQQEAVVVIDIDLTQLIAELRIDEFNVQTKDINQEQGEGLIYSNIAYLCNTIDGSDTTATTTTFTQGDIINVCVKPDPAAIEDGIKIGSIDSLIFSRDGPIILSQDAVIDSAASTNGLSTYSNIDCNGKEYCSVSTILVSSFFQTPGTVSGSGEASLTFFSSDERNLNEANHRSLQDNNEVDGAISAFDMDLNVMPADDSPTTIFTASATISARLTITTVSIMIIMTIMVVTVLLFS